MRVPSSERGFILAALLFFITATAVALATLIPSYIMQSKRDREEELIFRGAEYARAIRKFSNKYGVLPLTVDELMMGSDGIPSLRKHYLDPTTGEDFRPIYLQQDGTLQGSLIYLNLRDARTNTAQTAADLAEVLSDEAAANGDPTGGAGGGAANPAGGVANLGANQGTNNLLANQGTGLGNNQATNLLGNQGTNLTGQNPAPANTANAAATPQTTETFQQTGLVGMGSTNDKLSIRKYVNQDRYINWEFIANVNRVGRRGGAQNAQNPAQTQTPATGTTGTNLTTNQGTNLTGGAARGATGTTGTTGTGTTGTTGAAAGGGGGGARGGNN